MALELEITSIERDAEGFVIGWKLVKDGEDTAFSSAARVPRGSSKAEALALVHADAARFKDAANAPNPNVQVGERVVVN